MSDRFRIAAHFDRDARAMLYAGDCLEFLRELPDKSVQLIVTSPPYNIGKSYERRAELDHYVEWQRAVIRECHRVLRDTGSICWQLGNYVSKSGIVPLARVATEIRENRY